MSIFQKIFVAGHRGMVGSAIVRKLLADGTPASALVSRTHAELDLTNQPAVQAFFAAEKPTQVYLAAAKVGGIHANNNPQTNFVGHHKFHIFPSRSWIKFQTLNIATASTASALSTYSSFIIRVRIFWHQNREQKNENKK